MLIVVSGEGVTDMGRCIVADDCCGNEFEPGPMACLVDQMLESLLGYAFLPLGLMHFVSKSRVSSVSKGLRPPTLAGRKRKQETAYFFRNARAMAHLSRDLAEGCGEDDVVAVLFRDADKTRSTVDEEWQDKRDSMLNGFAFESFNSGVPMVPNPKSEAWLLCALKKVQPYQHCDRLELESGNDDAPNSLKAQLAAALGGEPSAVALAERVRSGEVDPNQIDMPSFVAFRTRLEQCVCPWTEGSAGD
jgi:hypothetical protein